MASDMIVLDASVALEWVLPKSPERNYVDAVLVSIIRGEVVAHAPEMMTLEYAYVLRKAVGQKRLSADQARECAQAIDRVTGNIHTGRAPFVDGALATADHYDLAAYDACYFDLAMYLGCSIATTDNAIRRACERFDVSLYLSEIAG